MASSLALPSEPRVLSVEGASANDHAPLPFPGDGKGEECPHRQREIGEALQGHQHEEHHQATTCRTSDPRNPLSCQPRLQNRATTAAELDRGSVQPSMDVPACSTSTFEKSCRAVPRAAPVSPSWGALRSSDGVSARSPKPKTSLSADAARALDSMIALHERGKAERATRGAEADRATRGAEAEWADRDVQMRRNTLEASPAHATATPGENTAARLYPSNIMSTPEAHWRKPPLLTLQWKDSSRKQRQVQQQQQQNQQRPNSMADHTTRQEGLPHSTKEHMKTYSNSESELAVAKSASACLDESEELAACLSSMCQVKDTDLPLSMTPAQHDALATKSSRRVNSPPMRGVSALPRLEGNSSWGTLTVWECSDTPKKDPANGGPVKCYYIDQPEQYKPTVSLLKKTKSCGRNRRVEFSTIVRIRIFDPEE